MVRSKRTAIVVMLVSLFYVLGLGDLDRYSVASPLRSRQWSHPRQIPGYGSDVLTPIFVVGPDDTVHAFNSDWLGSDQSTKAVVHSRWQPATGWTLPVDIVLSPRGQARVHGAFLDQRGIMHLIFFGGDDMGADIYYTRAPVDSVHSARSWSVSRIIGRAAVTPDEAVIAGDGNGNIYVVYGGRQAGNGLYEARSSDNGETWTEASPIFLTHSQELWPSALKIHLDDQGNLHVVWGVGDTSGNSLAVYYTSLWTNGAAWNNVQRLAAAMGREADTPAIIAYDDQLIVIYHNDDPTTRWMRRSFDNGQSWDEPIRIFPDFVGSNGPAALVVDGDNALHAFFGNRTGSAIIQGMWHSTFSDGRWLAPEAITSGTRVSDTPGGSGFDPSFAKAVVLKGNIILVAWRTDPGAGPNGAWYTFSQVKVIPTNEGFNPSPEPTSPAAGVEDPLSGVLELEAVDDAPQDESVAVRNVSQDAGLQSPIAMPLLGLIPVSFLLLFIVIIRIWREARR